MSGVFEGYEKQYCELSDNLSKKCASAKLLDGGLFKPLFNLGTHFLCFTCSLMRAHYCMHLFVLLFVNCYWWEIRVKMCAFGENLRGYTHR